ncbi:MAG: HAMP domain-containing sensor histidine kinase [Chloroflexota bacterium]
MTDHPNYDKLLMPLQDVTASVETLLEGAFGRLMGDQREVLKRIHASAWALHTLILEVVTNLGIENIAKRPYLPQKFDNYLVPLHHDADNLLKGLDGPLTDEQHVAVNFIRMTGHLLRRYIDNLWLYSQLLHDLYHLDKQLTPLDRLIDPMQWSVTTNPVELEVFVSEQVPSVRVDVKLIQVAITQLVENAINNTQEGYIRVQADLEADAVVFRVVDTGCGISPSEQPHIFMPFFQGQSDKLGLGLGLPIAQKCLMLHSGTVQIKSEDQLTIATTRLPIK